METSRPVVVKRVPERLDKKHARTFVNEIAPLLQSDRPQIVFDLSQVRQIDAAGIDMLLGCVTEVTKRDGDIKLAALSSQAAIVLEFTRTARLFETYETTAEAVSSFSGFMPNIVRQLYGPLTPTSAAKSQSTIEDSNREPDEEAGNVAA